ncbi:putative potassium transporter [Lupinus albus]|uniref:Putative potassium transporter n=1 Tax=Lupinus albus TaxID=3870 RepID=A0A6A4QIB5_LUPAL|nr:putative potassium transporter [Lupinus albus]
MYKIRGGSYKNKKLKVICVISLKLRDTIRQIVSLKFLHINASTIGGTFALYSLICRYANVDLLPNRQQADEHISSFRLKLPTPELKRALKIKDKLEKKKSLKILLLLLVLLETSMVIGDGILTPAMSEEVVIISIVVVVTLFSIQQFGTSKVGFLFAPILGLWFFSLGSIGVYNVVKYHITVLRAINPVYIFYFFKKNGKCAWSALGGCVLCITELFLKLSIVI